MPEYEGGLEIFSTEEWEERRRKWRSDHPIQSWYEDWSAPVYRRLTNAWHFFRYDIPNGITNLWRWFPEVWRLRDWDDCYIWGLMARQMSYMAKSIGENGHHLNNERTAKQLRIAAECCRRLADDWEPGNTPPGQPFDYDEATLRRWIYLQNRANRRKKAGLPFEKPVNPALRILCKELERHSRSWWD